MDDPLLFNTVIQFFYRLQNWLVGLVLIILMIVGCRLWPHTPLSEGIPRSTQFYAKNGELLRLTLASDDRYRLWTPIEALSPLVIQGVMLHEDQWFYYHPGFNPLSLIRGGWKSYIQQGNRQGGSTITMQLARMHWRLNTRTISGKLKQIGRAMQLELFYSKKAILEAYFNYAPYGRNIESIGAASLIYFNKQPSELTLTEALTLAVLPQSPSIRMNKNTDHVGPSLIRARNKLYKLWKTQYPVEPYQDGLFTLTLPIRQPENLPFLVPHFIEGLVAQHHRQGRQEAHIQTTIDLKVQTLLEDQINAFIQRTQIKGIKNAAAIVVDSRDMGVVALVGSADYFNREIHGQVNGTLGKRSPGSTLKPFIYGLALDQGLIHPMTMLKDVPTTFSSYSPENHDRSFSGLISATHALIYSRNIPAVSLAAKLKRPNFYQFLRQSGVSSMASERHYGLALALGGGEVTMQELAKLYSMLTNKGHLKALRFEAQERQQTGPQMLSEEASYLVLEMLGQAPRPYDIRAESANRLPFYWKTGTSWAYRDGWSAGVIGPYVVIVWVGNFNGKGDPAFFAAKSAAPLFFNIAYGLQASVENLTVPYARPPENIKKVPICLASGNLVTVWCQRKGSTWFIPGKSPIEVDHIYRPVVIDNATNAPLCHSAYGRSTRIEVYEYWPSDIRRLYANMGLPRRMPPDMSHCQGVTLDQGMGDAPLITSPLLNTAYTLKHTREDQSIVLTTTTDSDVKDVYWFIDNSFLGKAKRDTGVLWRPQKNGRYEVRVVDDHGRAMSRRTTVTIISRDKASMF